MAASLKGKVKGYLGQLSRNLDLLKGSVELAKATRSDHDIKRMEEYQKIAQGYLHKVVDLTIEINVLEPATGAETETAADKTLEKWQNQYDASMNEFFAARKVVATPAPVNPVAPDGTAGAVRPKAIRPKSNDAMKPDQLAPDAKPSVLRAWKKRFQVYYESHNMAEMPINEQQLYFMSCLTSKLESRMNDKVKDPTPVMPSAGASESCLELLEAEFLVTYPIESRRHDLFSCHQAHNESLTDFLIRLFELAQEADLEKLKKDDIILFLGLAGTCNKEFQRDFLRGEKHTLDQLKKMAQQYVKAESTVRGLKDTSKVHKVNQKGPNWKQKDRGKPGQQQSSQTCWRCLTPCSPEHNPNSCRFKTANCKQCGKLGHIKVACPSNTRRAQVKTAEGDDQEEEEPDTAEFKAVRAVNAARANGVFASSKMITSKGKVTKVKNPHNRPTPKMEVTLSGLKGEMTPSSALPDTGATQTIVSRDHAKSAKLKVDPEGAIPILAADGLEMKCEGSTEIDLTYQDTTAKVIALVSSTVEDELIVSWHDLIKLRVIHEDFPNRITVQHSDVKAAAAAHLKSAAQLHTSETGQLSLDELLAEYKDVLSNQADGISRAPVWSSPEEPEEEEESGSYPTAHLRSAHAIDKAEDQSVGLDLNLNEFIKKCQGKFNDRLRELRNHPRADSFSPAYEPIDTRRAEVTRQAERDRNKERHDLNARNLRQLTPQELVLVQNAKTGLWDQHAIVERSHQQGRSYLLSTPTGKMFYRNRTHLRPCPRVGMKQKLQGRLYVPP